MAFYTPTLAKETAAWMKAQFDVEAEKLSAAGKKELATTGENRKKEVTEKYQAKKAERQKASEEKKASKKAAAKAAPTSEAHKKAIDDENTANFIKAINGLIERQEKAEERAAAHERVMAKMLEKLGEFDKVLKAAK
jgi:hypothetical protein